MNGLILKDWLYTRTAFLISGGLVIVLAGFLVPLGVGGVIYLGAAYLVVLLSANVMTMDTSSHWERYALILPLTRREILAARYRFSLLCFAMAAMFCLVAAVLARIFLPPGSADLLGISPLAWWAGTMGVALLLFDILFAVYYRYRKNVGVYVVVFITVLLNIGVYLPWMSGAHASDGVALALVLAAAGLAGLWVSWRTAATAYEKWDAD